MPTKTLPSPRNKPLSLRLHGERIAPIAQAAKMRLKDKDTTRFSRTEREEIARQIQASAASEVVDGVDFSRLTLETLLECRRWGGKIDFETLGPYLANYRTSHGDMTPDNLIPEDAIGLELAATFRRLFPYDRLVSLYDEYNGSEPGGTLTSTSAGAPFTDAAKRNFRNSLLELFRSNGAIPPDAKEGRDFLLIAESQKVTDAEKLVEALETKGLIQRNGQEVMFVNIDAENPLHMQIRLRTKNGRWLCEALDAATFLKPENPAITHIVVLPEYMRDQQDRVWEILRVLKIEPERYHNIFFDPLRASKDISRLIESVLGA